MDKKVVLVLDCGATNVRAIAVDAKGNILANHQLPNRTAPDPFYPDYRIWDVEEIWDKFVVCIRKTLQSVQQYEIAAVTVTAFGVDGAPFTGTGKMLYPVISWQCERTQPVMDNIDTYFPLDQLFRLNGLQPFGFNTINKLIWIKENKPDLFGQMERFLFIPSIFIYFLTGEMVNDTSMAGTSMLTDLKRRTFSDDILSSIDMKKEKLFPLVEPGTVVGKIQNNVAERTGLAPGIPVVTAGHDTQFAIFGAGAAENIPVLSSGTWEILMVRTKEVRLDSDLLTGGVTTELDPVPGLYNMGVQWIASGAVEWIRKIFFRDVERDANVYDLMIEEAEEIPPGSHDVKINPSFYPLPGSKQTGAISGINLNTGRGEIFRASLEALSFKTKAGLKTLQDAGNFKAGSLICVGGGAKNKLWNQIRADILDLPIRVIDQKETTVIGAALFAMAGIGVYESADEARSNIDYTGDTFFPDKNKLIYQNLADDYLTFLD